MKRDGGGTELRALLAAVALLASGCGSIAEASKDETRLSGSVPVGIGPRLEVVTAGVEGQARGELLAAIAGELEGRDLFERVTLLTGPSASIAPVSSALAPTRLDLALVSLEQARVADAWTISTAFVTRVGLDVALRDGKGEVVLHGRVTGVAVDEVSEAEEDEARAVDHRIAAFHDAAAKISRALRRAADERAAKALEEVRPLRLPAGVGPVLVAVVGFDDEKNARHLRGPVLVARLAEALSRLGSDVTVAATDEVRRALDDVPASGFLRVASHVIEDVGTQVPARLFVVGRITVGAGRVSAECRVLDRSGKEVAAGRSHADGLGAVRCVAADLARLVGTALEQLGPERTP